MCNDIENNMNEIIIPEITKKDVRQLNDIYFKRISEVQLPDIQYDNDDEIDQIQENMIYKEFRYNELIDEHVNIIEKLTLKVSHYNCMKSTHKHPFTSMEQIQQYLQNRITKRLFYFNEIEPLLTKDKENLFEVISVLETDEQAQFNW